MGWPDDWELPVKVEAAFGAEPAGDPGSWSWTDLSSRLLAEPIRLRAGKSGGAASASPATCTVALLNDDSALTPGHPMSPYWPNVDMGTPLRVSLPRVEDAFARTLSDGWGTADSGQAWEGYGAGGTTTATDFTVNGGKAHHSVPVAAAYRTSWLPDLRLRDCRVHLSGVTLLVDDLLGGSIEPGNILLRAQDWSQYYLARVEITAAQAVVCKLYDPAGNLMTAATVPDLTHSGGQPLEVVAEISGSRLSMKVWATATDEPAGWTATVTDHSLSLPGGIGVRTGVASGNTNTKPITVSYESITVWVDRFNGYADQWEPTFLPTTTPGQAHSAVRVTASGPLRRLSQGTPVSESPLRRTIRGAGPAAYWPVEDGTTAGQAASVIPGQAPLTVAGAVEFRPVEDYVDLGYTVRFGTSALADLSTGGQLSASVDGSVATATASQWTVHVAAGGIDPATIAGNVVLLEWTTPGGSFVRWRLVAQKDPTRTQVWGYNAAGAGTLLIEYVGLLFGFAHYAVSAQQVGSDVWVDLYVSGNEPDGGSNTHTGTLAGIGSITANPTGTTSTAEMPFGHVAVFAAPAPPFNFAGSLDDEGTLVNAAWASYEGETATARLARLAAEDGIALDLPPVPAADLTRMGPQHAGAPLDLYRECEDAELGILYEHGFGLAYLPRAYRYNRPAEMTIDLSTYCVTGGSADVLKPVWDDRGKRNHLTVERRNGSAAVAADVDSQRRHGVYTDSVELNLASDDQLADQAAWRLHIAGGRA